MDALKLSTVLALLILTEAGQADPLDTWTWRNPLPTGNTPNDIAYGNGQFVAVKENGKISESGRTSPATIPRARSIEARDYIDWPNFPRSVSWPRRDLWLAIQILSSPSTPNTH
jgi:hypothetical protein